ncbi:lipoprotein insertase outer membrane protein LolB [Ketobacter sp.]|uniref:lipoprotein insertase outer membrane protein LolB n=1 Tax=Ketobacter sp. TaxID=2083498 RepID=UPI0025BE2112|nr:lipoprotein insertase outer membrane protein LolB [Ketobacter sp.]
MPADPESLNEWSVEGQVSIKNGSGKQKTWFEYRQVDGEYQLSLRPDSPVGEAKAVISGYEGEPDVALEVKDPEARELANAVRENLPMDNLSFWLRALPAGGDAKITTEEDRVEQIKEANWDIEYDNYMEVGRYRIPDKISLKKQKTKVEMELVRAETGYLSTPCPTDFDVEAVTSHADSHPGQHYGATIDHLVPRNGEAPLPRWINDQDFCKQLYKVHGSIPDARIGLYGPDSMMWRLTSRVTPAAMGAGRALLLQTAHPWITAGIDEHSIVRYDPLERARRTFIYISTIVYGSMPQVMEAANTVHKIHNAIEGQIPYQAGAFKEGSHYGANEVSAMIWVSATLWDTLAKMYEEYEEPLTPAEQDQFYEEIKLFNMIFGIPESANPPNWTAFEDYVETMVHSPQLTVTDNAKLLKEDLFNQGGILALPLWVQEVTTSINLPAPIREQYDMDYGLWYSINYYGWIKPSSKLYNWLMPDSVSVNPVYHEAQARLRGERVGWYQRKVIEAAGVERLVN